MLLRAATSSHNEGVPACRPAGLTCLTGSLLPTRTQNKQGLQTGGAGEDLKSLKELQPDVGLVLQRGHGEQQGLSQVTALEQLQPVAGRGRLEACMKYLNENNMYFWIAGFIENWKTLLETSTGPKQNRKTQKTTKIKKGC